MSETESVFQRAYRKPERERFIFRGGEGEAIFGASLMLDANQFNLGQQVVFLGDPNLSCIERVISLPHEPNQVIHRLADFACLLSVRISWPCADDVSDHN